MGSIFGGGAQQANANADQGNLNAITGTDMGLLQSCLLYTSRCV